MNIRDININYVQYGNKKGKNVVLLHGWGQNTTVMDIIGKRLEKYCYITNIDFPGFGKSEEPKKKITIYEYEEIIEILLNKLNIENPILIGHSFGGRVSIIYASKHKVEKLVLLASPFRVKSKKTSLKTKILKLLKDFPILKKYENYFKSKMGSIDYRNASPIMREVLVDVVNTDLTKELEQITSPTLLIWGTNDVDVPIEEARYAESIMKNAALIELYHGTHYAFIEQIDRLTKILENFFEINKSRRNK